MAETTKETRAPKHFPAEAQFNVAEILPGEKDTSIHLKLHAKSFDEIKSYEAVSYALGNVTSKVSVCNDDKELEVSEGLYMALNHLRYEDRSRILWAEELCIEQEGVSNRGEKIKQRKRIFENADAVISWLGPDPDNQASKAVSSLKTISDFLCKKMNIKPSDLKQIGSVCEFVFKHRTTLPVPDDTEFSTPEVWKNLAWFYSLPYYTQFGAIQELNAGKSRFAQCGYEVVEWDVVELVAGYLIMETDFSKRQGFSKSNVWWAATTTELKRPENWLFMLYLASNYGCLDPRDVIYGLRGLMKFSKGAEILKPDYNKQTLEVYRDSVEAALVNFENTNVLLYLTGKENPSWIPAWNEPMLFRNPFRFGNSVPWKPAGDTKAVWSIDKDQNLLSIDGFTVDTIKLAFTYNETYFGNTTLNSEEGKATILKGWKEILGNIETGTSASTPLSREILNSAASAFSYGLNETSVPTEETYLLLNFVAYLKIVLDEETYQKYVPAELTEEAANTPNVDGLQFGKPVWDFTYPPSSFFVTESGLLGACVSETAPGDIVAVPLGSTYPHVLRPDGDNFRVRGFTYTYGVMHGERKDSPIKTFSLA
ncbi:hypothetical protein ABW19_dt0206404 [Dactylella cylindrospora]|nr:hypothetical protein ABW19_dt0206404 [Dactylella cylindrospora]